MGVFIICILHCFSMKLEHQEQGKMLVKFCVVFTIVRLSVGQITGMGSSAGTMGEQTMGIPMTGSTSMGASGMPMTGPTGINSPGMVSSRMGSGYSSMTPQTSSAMGSPMSGSYYSASPISNKHIHQKSTCYS